METLLITDKEVAKLLGISSRHVWSLNSTNQLPEPVTLGRTTRWSLQELRDWVYEGCPSRLVWLNLKNSRRNQAAIAKADTKGADDE